MPAYVNAHSSDVGFWTRATYFLENMVHSFIATAETTRLDELLRVISVLMKADLSIKVYLMLWSGFFLIFFFLLSLSNFLNLYASPLRKNRVCSDVRVNISVHYWHTALSFSILWIGRFYFTRIMHYICFPASNGKLRELTCISSGWSKSLVYENLVQFYQGGI